MNYRTFHLFMAVVWFLVAAVLFVLDFQAGHPVISLGRNGPSLAWIGVLMLVYSIFRYTTIRVPLPGQTAGATDALHRHREEDAHRRRHEAPNPELDFGEPPAPPGEKPNP